MPSRGATPERMRGRVARIFRWTADFVPRLLYRFYLVGEQPLLSEEVRRLA
jgi:hypothetical protein